MKGPKHNQLKTHNDKLSSNVTIGRPIFSIGPTDSTMLFKHVVPKVKSFVDHEPVYIGWRMTCPPFVHASLGITFDKNRNDYI